jgi:hypothetical protein
MVAPSQPLIGKVSKDKDVMGALRQKKTGAKKQNVKLNSAQIIQASAKKEMPDLDINKFMSTLGTMVQRKMVQLLQIGNTVFLLKPKSPTEVEFHTFTVETPESLVKRYQAGVNSLKEMGFKKAVSYATSPAFNKIAQQTGLPVKISQSQQMIGGKMVPAYKYELDL